MIQIWQVPSECGPSNLVVLGLFGPLKVSSAKTIESKPHDVHLFHDISV